MMLAGVLTLVFFGYCIGMSALAETEKRVVQLPAFHLASVVAYFGLAAGILTTYVPLGHPLMTIPSGVLVLIFGVVLGWRYAAFLIEEYFDRANAGVMGIGSMKVERTYDRARKAEHEGDLDAAYRLYAEEAEADAGDAEPLRRMAELDVRRGRKAEALALLGRALDRSTEAGAKAALALRAADLLEEEGRAGEAAIHLETVVASCPGTPMARGAQERLASLRR